MTSAPGQANWSFQVVDPSVQQESPLLEATDLGRRFRDRWAVRGVNLELNTGQMVGIVGPDGAGKTTLLQMLAGILDPTEGTCHAFGMETRTQSKAIAAHIGYMTQGFTLYDRLSVEENLHLAAALRALPPPVYAERRRRLLEMAGLGLFTDRIAGNLSGGMRKKLSLCTNLIHEPSLLILDEPGLGVDPLSRRQLWDMLAAFRLKGIAIVVATSYMDEAERCDRLLLLREGKVIAVDAPAAVRSRAAGRMFQLPDSAIAMDTLLSSKNVHAIQRLPGKIRFQLTEGAAAPPEAEVSEPTLEDVFTLETAEEPPAAFEYGMRPALPENGIDTDAVTVRFGRFCAVDHVTLSVPPGKLLALLGPNGAGKTTLIRALCGLAPIAEGSARIAGHSVAGESRVLRQNVGYMSQRFSLYWDLTPEENLRFFASAYGLIGDVVAERIHWACEHVGIDNSFGGLVADQSGAERQRLALACSILHRPSVLFLDEPTSGVDPLARYRFWTLIRRLATEGMTILVTTHYLNESIYCDSIGLMHQGRLIAHGSLEDLRRLTDMDPQAAIEDVFVRAIERAQKAAA